VRKNQDGFAHILLFLIIVIVVGVIGFAGWQVYKKQNHKSGGYNNSASYSQSSHSGSSGGTSRSALPACNGSALLNHLPANQSDFSGVEALGHLNSEHIMPGQGDHAGIIMLPASSNTSKTTNVYSPGDVTLVEVIEDSHHDTLGSITDYALYFAPCKNVVFEYGHIEHLTDQKIVSALSNVKATCSNGSIENNCMYMNMSVKLNSGELIGTAGGPSFKGNGFDLGASDDRTKPLAFIDTSSTAQTGVIQFPGNSSYQHAVCPLDYFTSSVKQELYAKLTMKHAGANGIPACGTTMQDKPGTIQGDWFDQKAKSGTSGQGIDIPGLLAFAHSNLDASLAEVSVGTDLVQSQWGGTQLMVTPMQSGYINRDPSKITPDGHVYCYEGREGAVLDAQGDEIHFDVQLTDSNSLKIDYGTGACSANPRLSNPTVYAR
jgi:hypothetical protein